MLHEQLDRVALMLEQSAPYSHREAFVWRCLARHVDVKHFERSGQILTPVLTPEQLMDAGVKDASGYSAADVQDGVATLTTNGLLSVQQGKQGTFYRLHLPQGVLLSAG